MKIFLSYTRSCIAVYVIKQRKHKETIWKYRKTAKNSNTTRYFIKNIDTVRKQITMKIRVARNVLTNRNINKPAASNDAVSREANETKR